MVESENFANQGLHDASYEDSFSQAFTGDLCENTGLVLDHMPVDCSLFISNSALHVSIVETHIIGIANSQCQILWNTQVDIGDVCK